MSEIRFVARHGEPVRQVLERGEGLDRDTASEEITDEFRLALLLTAFRRFAVSRAAVPPEVWKVFDFPRRSFALASGCTRHLCFLPLNVTSHLASSFRIRDFILP